ncbi:MAG: signal peptidase [Candidatus Poribacteria bacterium]|nr:signal peptidase [Candidatus Poribacteria bacterium]
MKVANDKPSLITQIKDIMPMLIIAIIIVAADQLTKTIIRGKLAVIGTLEVIKGFFEFSYSQNTGAAFGTFHDKNSIFIVVNLIAIIFIFIYHNRYKENIWMKVSLGFILGGALGNLADRIFFGFVTDFIRVRLWFIHTFWWPNFNIADSGVTVGAIMLIIVLFRDSYKGRLQD